MCGHAPAEPTTPGRRKLMQQRAATEPDGVLVHGIVSQKFVVVGKPCRTRCRFQRPSALAVRQSGLAEHHPAVAGHVQAARVAQHQRVHHTVGIADGNTAVERHLAAGASISERQKIGPHGNIGVEPRLHIVGKSLAHEERPAQQQRPPGCSQFLSACHLLRHCSQHAVSISGQARGCVGSFHRTTHACSRLRHAARTLS